VRPFASNAENGKRWQTFLILGTFRFDRTFSTARLSASPWRDGVFYLEEELSMDGIIYLVGLIVIIMFILSFFGLR
jgi:hypothetical protein